MTVFICLMLIYLASCMAKPHLIEKPQEEAEKNTFQENVPYLFNLGKIIMEEEGDELIFKLSLTQKPEKMLVVVRHQLFEPVAYKEFKKPNAKNFTLRLKFKDHNIEPGELLFLYLVIYITDPKDHHEHIYLVIAPFKGKKVPSQETPQDKAKRLEI